MAVIQNMSQRHQELLLSILVTAKDVVDKMPPNRTRQHTRADLLKPVAVPWTSGYSRRMEGLKTQLIKEGLIAEDTPGSITIRLPRGQIADAVKVLSKQKS
eukprot:Blabericola_migrator_1__7821@NODE_3_length_32604_cov_133_371700_g2_i0_p38_GENE_NODE_3_length_32604_cov_133_371700_g2_i0NODE_3_length_32604_cov_133_371700_g2_i0_p38_ORF_typecomplete_len101_score17_47_NODE_3_length_32604_cov_133_371700_g2_i02640926711